MRTCFFGLLAALALSASAAEFNFEFSQLAVDQAPQGFRSALLGSGQPPVWKVVVDQASSQASNAPTASGTPVLAQLSRDPTDEHFPLLIYDGSVFDDFTLTTHFKLVSGTMEQMAGVAFRLQNETNFYVVRASGLGNNIRFYKVVNGERGNLVGPDIPIAKDVWHELSIVGKGNQFHIKFDGKEFPPLTDNAFDRGKFAFWTKSDAVSYFGDTKLLYTPREAYAKTIVRDMLREYPRLAGLRIYVLDPEGQPRVIASKVESEVGAAGGKDEKDIIANDASYFGREKGTVAVSLPLRDNNGDPIAAVRVILNSFPGETQQNAFARATPIVKTMQARVRTLKELTQ